MRKKKRELRAVGVNIFAGGFTVGVSQHFEILAHLEHDDYGAEIVERNFPHLPIFTSKEDWHEFKPGDVDFIFANPPCAVWSQAGVNKGDEWKDDPRLGRIKDIFTLLDKWRPRAWAWESVTGACGRGWPFVKSLIKKANRIGYSATVVFINTRWHGVPQSRRRFFLVLHDVQIPWIIPEYKDGPTAFEVIKGVAPNVHMKPFNKTYLKVVKRMKPGEGYNDVFDRVIPPQDRKKNKRGQVMGRGAFLTHRLNTTGVAGTVVGAQMIHPTEHRMLSVNEPNSPLSRDISGTCDPRQIAGASLPPREAFTGSNQVPAWHSPTPHPDSNRIARIAGCRALEARMQDPGSRVAGLHAEPPGAATQGASVTAGRDPQPFGRPALRRQDSHWPCGRRLPGTHWPSIPSTVGSRNPSTSDSGISNNSRRAVRVPRQLQLGREARPGAGLHLSRRLPSRGRVARALHREGHQGRQADQGPEGLPRRPQEPAGAHRRVRPQHQEAEEGEDMKAYLKILEEVLNYGSVTPQRAKVDGKPLNMLLLPGMVFRHDLTQGFPLLTTKFVPIDKVAAELEFFIKGEHKKSDLHKRNCHIWDEWQAPNQPDPDELGPVYGVQWRRWKAAYPANISEDGESRGRGIFQHEIDQLKQLVDTLMTNPYDRRTVVTAWNPAENHLVALPACHTLWQTVVTHHPLDGRCILNLCLTMRSADLMLGVPFNIASYALLTLLLAKHTKMIPGTLTVVMNNCHLYENHLDGAREQLSRPTKLLPEVFIPDRADGKPFDMFEWTYDQVQLLCYEHHDKIKLKVAV